MNPLILIGFFIFIFLPACGEQSSGNTKQNALSEKESTAKINQLLVNSQIDLSYIDSELPYEQATVKLDKYLYAFSGSVEVIARKRGVLLNNNKVITSIRVFIKNPNSKTNRTYAVLFDGKTILHSVLLGSNLSVVSIIQDESDDSIIEFSALVRKEGQPAKRVQTFKVQIKNDQLIFLDFDTTQ